jgi:zinc transport system ATP-binding protein
LLYGQSDDERIEKVLARVGLGGVANKKVKDFSLGMKQRLGIALALINGPELLILDEPVTGLDPLVSAELYESIAKLNRERKVAVIMVSHDIAGAVKYSDKVLHIGRGVEFFGTTEEYLASDLGKRFAGK